LLAGVSLVVGSLVGLGCGVPPPDRLEIDPPNRIQATDPDVETQLKVNGFRGIKAHDDKKAPLKVKWSTSDGTVAVVNSTGLVKSTGSGTAKITATVEVGEGKEISTSVDVKNVMVSTVEATGDFPKRYTLKAEPVTLKVVVKDEKGNVVEKPVLKFSTTDYCVEADNGIVKPIAVGPCAVIVESAGKSARIDLEVID